MGRQRTSREEWVRRVGSWRRSGETAKAFAARYGWNPSSLRWWASQERRTGAEGVAFVEVTPPEPLRTKSGLDVLLANGRRLRVRGDVDPDTVARLVRALEA